MQNEAGTLPVSLLFASARFINLLIDPMLEGRGPTRKLFKIFNDVSAVNAEILLGISPVKLLLLRSNATMFVSDANSGGKICLNLLVFAYKDVKDVKKPISVGIGPVRPLLLRYIPWSAVNIPIVVGKEPISEFFSKWSDVNDFR